MCWRVRAALVIKLGSGTAYPQLRNAKFFDNFLRHGYGVLVAAARN
jgi:hypothetical protein